LKEKKGQDRRGQDRWRGINVTDHKELIAKEGSIRRTDRGRSRESLRPARMSVGVSVDVRAVMSLFDFLLLL
jgi:hypothetical protein